MNYYYIMHISHTSNTNSQSSNNTDDKYDQSRRRTSLVIADLSTGLRTNPMLVGPIEKPATS